MSRWRRFAGPPLQPPQVTAVVDLLEDPLGQVTPEKDDERGAAADDVAEPRLLHGERGQDRLRHVRCGRRRALHELVGDGLARPEAVVIGAGRVARPGCRTAVVGPATRLDYSRLDDDRVDPERRELL